MNVATGGFGTEVTVKTDPRMKQQLGGAAYILTGVHLLPTCIECSVRATATKGFAQWHGTDQCVMLCQVCADQPDSSMIFCRSHAYRIVIGLTSTSIKSLGCSA